jgi:hypothetical protein
MGETSRLQFLERQTQHTHTHSFFETFHGIAPIVHTVLEITMKGLLVG